MKAKKALKRVNQAEALLSDVLDGFGEMSRDVRELIGSAKAALGRPNKNRRRRLRKKALPVLPRRRPRRRV